MNTAEIPLKTEAVEPNNGLLAWPPQVSDKTYMIAYLHSELKVGRAEPLCAAKLYEAWAFDGRRSWHLWQRDGQWVCTEFDTKASEHSLRTKQLVSRKIAGKLKECLQERLGIPHGEVDEIDIFLKIHETVAFDKDGQAYVAYACPIQFAAKRRRER